MNKIEENSREIFSFWSQLFTGLALNSSHIQMNYETILLGNQLSYHFTGHSSHRGRPFESLRIVGSLHSIRPSGLDLSTGLANRFNWSPPGWNPPPGVIYGIDMLVCGMRFVNMKRHFGLRFVQGIFDRVWFLVLCALVHPKLINRHPLVKSSWCDIWHWCAGVVCGLLTGRDILA